MQYKDRIGDNCKAHTGYYRLPKNKNRQNIAHSLCDLIRPPPRDIQTKAHHDQSLSCPCWRSSVPFCDVNLLHSGFQLRLNNNNYRQLDVILCVLRGNNLIYIVGNLLFPFIIQCVFIGQTLTQVRLNYYRAIRL